MTTRQQDAYLHEQLARELSQQIADGVYAVGEKLPSIRKLCAQRRISVATAMQALSILESRGMIEARPKSGYFIKQRHYGRVPEPGPSLSDLRPQTVGDSDIVAQVFRQAGEADKVPLGAVA